MATINPGRTATGADAQADALTVGLAWAWLAALTVAASVWANGLMEAFAYRLGVQDDARHFVAFLQRYADPALFPGDAIADYFTDLTPVGVRAFYWVLAQAGLDPLTANRILPAALGLAVAVYAFRLGHRLFPHPLAGAVTSILATLLLSMWDTLAAGTPRGFAYPLLLAFLFYLADRRPVAVTVTVGLSAVVYPQVTLLAMGVLGLTVLDWKNGRPALVLRGRRFWTACAGIAAGLLLLLPFALGVDAYGPAVTPAEARSMATFQPDGGTPYFLDDPIRHYLCGMRSGYLVEAPACDLVFGEAPYLGPAVAFVFLAINLLLPFWAWRLAPAGDPRRATGLLLVTLAASAVLFVAAHVLLFQLHLPSRYSQLTGYLVIVISLALLLARAGLWVARRMGGQGAGILGVALVAFAGVAPWAAPFLPFMNYKVTADPGLHDYLATTPKDTLVATLSDEGRAIPAFSRRSVYISEQFVVPYNLGYYRPMVERRAALIEAQYGWDLTPLRDLVRQTGIDVIVLDRSTFGARYPQGAKAFRDVPELRRQVTDLLEVGVQPALARRVAPCRLYESATHVVVDAACVIEGRDP